ncbi:MFS general substrate transporter [Ophiocordyceps camponoti-floridani]|uniref:MFS general substrate transporter n=1 Tax=Ophiocordyceps camponoti-floridani TaxID=2030778 RepID=A0A8H4Q9S0_9HYPO|nr:MFS general substrate transporter [Ophiocordyceps camponoti-floridani]
METGDFDDTPAPSGRPSMSELQTDGDDGFAREADRGSGPRHHLLKTSTSGSILVDGDELVSTPRARQQASKAIKALLPLQMSMVSPENKVASPMTPYSPIRTSLPTAANLLSDRSPNRPLRQPDEPAFAQGRHHEVDVSDERGFRQSDVQRSPSAETALWRSSATRTPVAEEPAVDLGSYHHGPSRVSKARPAHHHYPAHHIVPSGEQRVVNYGPPRSKVAPFDVEAQESTSGDHEEIKFASGSSTAVSDAYDPRPKDSPLRIMVDSVLSQAPSFRGRPKVHAIAEDSEKEHMGSDSDASNLFQWAAPRHVFDLSASKVRPFLSSLTVSDAASPYGRHSKARPMAGSYSPTKPSPSESTDGSGTPDEPEHHQKLHVPVAKVRPFVDDTFDAANHPKIHHHCSKVQPFSDSPSAFPSQSALDQCEACNATGQPRDEPPVEGEMTSAARQAGERDGGEDARLLPDTTTSKHSISADAKYPTWARPQTHSISLCGQDGKSLRGEASGTSRRPSFRKTPVPFLKSSKRKRVDRAPSPAEVDSPLFVANSSEDEEAPANQHTQGFVSTVVFGGRPSKDGSGGRRASSPAGAVIHAPVPISKVRPHFQEHVFEMDARHHPVSKVRVADTGAAPAAAQREGSEGTEGDLEAGIKPSARSGRSQSWGSVIDYRHTFQWLKDVLMHRDSHSTRFTERPGKSEEGCASSPETRRHSENLFASIKDARRLRSEKTVVRSGDNNARFDGHGFKRTVSDIERLLNEALSIASQVVDRPGEDEPRKDAGAGRPKCRHAATDSGLHKRPRLHDILQSYSGEGVDLKMRNAYPRPVGEAFLSPKIPNRGSSKNPMACVDPGAHTGRMPGGRARPTDKVAVRSLTGHRHGQGRADDDKKTSKGAARVSHGDAENEEEAAAPPEEDNTGRPRHGISLRRRSHVSLRGAAGFSLAKSRKRQPTARDWSPVRKRFVAAVACISTALVGVILGIYAGLVPSIQYYIIDQSHATVHGNTGCFLGLAVPTLFFWPLPLLHGRKPYILLSLVVAMPLLFPQALAVNSQRLTKTQSWRAMLLASRTLMGVALGFASMNFHSTLLDLFGASLMSVNPHQEVVDEYDARRHGGGMGAWIGIWTWCWIGSLGVGFLMGTCIIDNYPPAWGFYVSILILALVLFLNVVCPEVRRSAFRRSIAEVRTGGDVSRRIARGEVMMHRVKTGPKWWGQEVYHGVALSAEMMRQPGFAVLTLYSAWIYAQVVLIMVLLGSLTSRLYQLRSPVVGLLVASAAAGAGLAIPFQKANIFSRSRLEQMNTNLATLNRRVAWSSHLVRRTVFTLLLPLAGICYAAVSSGPPMHFSVPTLFAASVGFLSCLAIAECNGLVMETFDCSDLSSGMVGRQRDAAGRTQKRTNYSSFPRVTAGFAAIHGLAFVLAAGATALGGLVTRTLGQQLSTGLAAGILLLLTLLLLLVLIRFSEVQIIPQCKAEAMDRLVEVRRRSSTRRASMPDDARAIMEEEQAWQPCMIGNPTGKKRRMNVLELGGLTRWQEIRKKNRLIDADSHLNRQAWDQGLEALDDQLSDLQRDARDFFQGSARRSRRARRTDDGSGTADESFEMGATGGLHGRYPERECVMSQTVGEESDGDEEEAVGRRRR